MDGWWGDLEVPLHVGFSGRAAEDAGVGMDERQILALLVGEAGLRCRVTHAAI